MRQRRESMINLKPTVVAGLTSDIKLLNLLRGPRVHFQFPPNPAEFPRITYYEIDNVPIIAGGKEIAADIYFMIDIWNKGSTSEIAAAADSIMTGIGFKREFARDLVENTRNGVIYHKTMRYKIKKGV